MIKSYNGDTPEIADSAFVSEMAYVTGDVHVKNEASVWPFVCIRGDVGPTTVDERTNVQDHTMLHEADIGEGVTIGHNVVVDQSTVESNCLIGISSSVLRGAVVEEGSIVAAGAIVREGQCVPEGSFAYGVPAEIRPLEEDKQKQIPVYAESYRSLRENYLDEGGFEDRK